MGLYQLIGPVSTLTHCLNYVNCFDGAEIVLRQLETTIGQPPPDNRGYPAVTAGEGRCGMAKLTHRIGNRTIRLRSLRDQRLVG